MYMFVCGAGVYHLPFVKDRVSHWSGTHHVGQLARELQELAFPVTGPCPSMQLPGLGLRPSGL